MGLKKNIKSFIKYRMPKLPIRVADAGVRNALVRALEDGAFALDEGCRALRALHGWSQADFAAELGMDVKVIKSIESGHGNPRLSSLVKIADVLDLKVAFVRPQYEAGLLDSAARAADEHRRREADYHAVASGKQSARERDAQNAMYVGDSAYELPSLE